MTYRLKISQQSLFKAKNLNSWRLQFELILDDEGVARYEGRLVNADIPQSTKHPVLLNVKHHFTLLIIRECHETIKHGDVKVTLTELKSRFWIVRGRSFVHKLPHKCVIC